MSEQRILIEQLKRLHDNAKISDLILKDDMIEATSSKLLLEILISQYATSLNDPCLMNICNQSQVNHHKYPLPIVFAIFKKLISQRQIQQALKLLHLHVDRKNQQKVHILIYNLTKIYQKLKLYPKQCFYLETLLKQQPFFPQAVHDLAITYTFQFNRVQEAIVLLQRHLNSVNAHHPLIHSAYLRCIDKSSEVMENVKLLQNKRLTLNNYYNLGLLYNKKGFVEKACQIFSQILNKLEPQIIEQKESDAKLLLFCQLQLVNIKTIQKKYDEASILAQSILESYSKVLDEQTKSVVIQISEKKENLKEFSETTNLKRDFFKISKKKNQKSCYYQTKATDKKEQSLIQNILGELKDRNDKKFRHLLDKQKSIDKFFKNIILKYEPKSNNLEINLKNSLKTAKKDLLSYTRGIDQEQYQHLEQQFENSRLIHSSELEGCDIEQSIRIILLNLQNLKNGQHNRNQIRPQPKPQGFDKLRSAKIIVRKNVNTVSLSKRPHLNIDRHDKLPTQRTNSNFRIKTHFDTPTQTRSVEKVKKKVKVKQQFVQNKAKENPLFTIAMKRKDFQDLEDKKLKNQVIIQSNDQFIESKKKIQEQSKKIIEYHQQIDLHTFAPSLAQIPSTKKMITQQKESQKQVKKSQEKISNLSRKETDKTEQNISKETDKTEQKISNKSLQQKKLTQKIIQDRCIQQQPQQRPQINKISFKNFEETKKSFKDFSIKASFKKIDTEKKSNKIIQNFLSKKKIESSFKKLQSNKTIERKNSKPLQNQSVSDKKSNKQRNLSPRQSSEFNFENTAQSEDKQAQAKLLASSFNLNTASLASFKNKHAKKSKLARESTFNQAMEGLTTPQIKKKPTSKMSTQFEVQMLKVAQFQRKQDWDRAYEKLLQIYKNFKKEDQKIQILLRIGSIFEKQEKFTEAEKTYLKCSKFNSADAFLSLGNLELKIGKIEQGVQNLEKANCIRRFDITIQNKLVYGYSLREDTMDKALKLAHCILKKQPNSLETLLITAGILEKQGLIEQAIQIVKAIDQVKKTEHIKHYLGILHLAGSNLKDAFAYFKQALALKPDYVPSLVETASIISQSYPRQAIAVLNKALQLSPGNRRALARLGKIYEAESDFENAMSTYKAGLETQVNYESYMKIGDCLAKKESYIEALLNYKEALNLKKTSEAYAKLAVMFEYKNDFPKAIQNYQLALSHLQPFKENIRKNYLLAIGRLYLKMGQYQTAINNLDQLLETTQSVQVFQLLGQAYFGNKQYHESLSFFERANNFAGGLNLEVLQNMAMCLDRLEQYLASKAIYEKIIQKNPNNLRCLNNLANILLITGQTNQAFFLFESIIEKTPKNIEKRLKLADIYAQVGDWSKVQYHLIQCYRQKQHDVRILQKLVVLYKEKRDNKMAAKYEKKLTLIKTTHKHKTN